MHHSFPTRRSSDLGRAARKDDFFTRRLDESGDPVPRALIRRRRAFGELMDSAMHIRVRCAVVMIERLQHRFRLLRGRRIVEIGEALAAHRFLEDRELSADRVQIEWQWLFSMDAPLLRTEENTSE